MLDLLSLWPAAWLLVLTAGAAVTDARAGVIPNWLTLSSLLGAAIAHAALAGLPALATALGAAAICAAAPLTMFVLRAMGGGDVKLFAAIGALCGTRLGLEVQLSSYGVALVLACVALWRERRLTAAMRGVVRIAKAAATRAPLPAAESLTAIRLGPAVFCASALSLGRVALQVAS